jgi:hypothetical protein
MDAIGGQCYEVSDTCGQPICGLQSEPLVAHDLEPVTQNPRGLGHLTVLIRPISRQQLRILAQGL